MPSATFRTTFDLLTWFSEKPGDITLENVKYYLTLKQSVFIMKKEEKDAAFAGLDRLGLNHPASRIFDVGGVDNLLLSQRG